jgi:hypothetical protein
MCLQQHASTVRISGRVPGRLRDASRRGGVRDILNRTERQLVQHLAGEGRDDVCRIARGCREVAHEIGHGRPFDR